MPVSEARFAAQIVAPGELPRTEFKARRVIDDRDLYHEKTGAR